MTWKPAPVWEHPDPFQIKSEIDIRKIYAGNRVLAKVAGKETWIVQCLRCSTVLNRKTETLLKGRGRCICRADKKPPKKIGPNGETARELKHEKREWKRLCRTFPDRVCREWLESFPRFFRDMGKRPTRQFICQKNTAGQYSASNCYWGPKIEAEFPYTRKFTHRMAKRLPREILEGLDISPDTVREILKNHPLPKYKQGEHLIKKAKNILLHRAIKEHRRRNASE